MLNPSFITLLAALALGSISSAQQGPVRVGAEQHQRAQDLGVGRLIADCGFRTIDGEEGSFGQLIGEGRGLLILTRDVGCPASKRYGPETARLSKRAAEQGFAVLYLNPNAADTLDEIRGEIEAYGLEGKYVHDPAGRIAKQLALRSTTEAFVLDAARTLVYRGAIDDRIGIGYQNDVAKNAYVDGALAAVYAQQQPEVRATTAPGCLLDFGTQIPEPSELTYHNRISRILLDNCLHCHRGDGIAPFSLDTYARAQSKRKMMDWVLEEELMPPWFADDEMTWLNDCSLNEADRTALVAWIRGDAAEGNPKEAHLERSFPGEWDLGEPDLIIALEEPVQVPAEGRFDYKYLWVQNPLEEDRWVDAIEIEAGDPEVVHHVLLFLEEPQREDESDREHFRRAQTGIEGYFAGMVPGQETTVYPPTMGKLLPAKAWIKLQVHYTPNGVETQDRTRIGFHFKDAPPAHEMVTSSAINFRFRVPPYADNHKVRASYRFREDGTLFSFAPHMHLRGKAFNFDLVAPDGTRKPLLKVDRYDFNWQLRYRLAEPLAIKEGTILEATAWYDNSEDNMANPDPSKSVAVGDFSDDEMMIGYFEWYRKLVK